MKPNIKTTLLESGIQIFAKRGYQDTTISDVAKHAGANIAAVNYHFGSKDQFFIEVLRESFQQAEAMHPVKGKLAPSASPTQKLTTIIRALLNRAFDVGSGGNFERIMCRSYYVTETPFHRAMQELQAMTSNHMETVLAEFLPGASSQSIVLAKINILTLATIPCKDPIFLERIAPSLTQAQRESLINLQVKSCLASIRALRV